MESTYRCECKAWSRDVAKFAALNKAIAQANALNERVTVVKAIVATPTFVGEYDCAVILETENLA